MRTHFSFCLLAISFLFHLLPFEVFGHYNPRGMTGGTVSCGISFDGMVYLGTPEGGVFVSTTTGLTAWRNRAVGLTEGNITALAHNGLHIYAGTASHGVFLLDGTAGGNDLYFNKANNGLTNLNILSLLAADTNTLFAGTDGGGLFKTTDRGANWNAVNNTWLNNKKVTSLAVAGTRIFALVENGGIYASDDWGGSWWDFGDGNVNSVNNSTRLSYNSQTDALLLLNNSGLWVSYNVAATMMPTWADASSGIPIGTDIRYLDNNGAKWFLATNQGIYETGSGTFAWTAANSGLTNTNTTVVVAIDDTLIAASVKTGLYKSDAGTISWSLNNTGFANVDVYALACLGDSIVVAAGERGVLVSKDIAFNYVRSNTGLTDSLGVQDLIFAENILMAATQNGGVFWSADTGSTWQAVNGGITSTNVIRLFYANGIKYAVDGSGKVYQSQLNETTLQTIQTGLPANVQPRAMAFYGEQIFLGTHGNGVYVKGHNDDSWSAFNTGLGNNHVTALAASSGKIFAGTHGSGYFVSNVETPAWTATSAPYIPHFDLVDVDPMDVLYMTDFAGYVVGSFKGGAIMTPNDGTTWIRGGHQFHLPTFTKIKKVDFVTSRVFVTTEHNAAQTNSLNEFAIIDSFIDVSHTVVSAPIEGKVTYLTITSNIDWEISASDSWITTSITEGKWNKHFTLTVDLNQGYARTGSVTISNGPIQKVVSIEQDGLNNLEETGNISTGYILYPNPAENRFTIEFSTLMESGAEIHLFDYQGKKQLSRSVSGLKRVTLDTDLPSGVYFLELRSESASEVQKLIIR